MDEYQSITREYITEKQYPDGRIDYSVKVNRKSVHNPEIDRTHKEHYSYRAAVVASARAKKELFDIIYSNDWAYFVTLTLGGAGHLKDEVIKHEWKKWRDLFRKNYPDAYYVAVPEYHKKGGLHVHIAIGGVTGEALGLKESGKVYAHWLPKKCCSAEYYAKNAKKQPKLLLCDGLTIFNVTSWTVGFSTATEVLNKIGVCQYLSKYVTKSSIDPRFCNNKRYWASKNVERPIVTKYDVDHVNDSKIGKLEDLPGFRKSYENADKYFFVLTNENHGELNASTDAIEITARKRELTETPEAIKAKLAEDFIYYEMLYFPQKQLEFKYKGDLSSARHISQLTPYLEDLGRKRR